MISVDSARFRDNMEAFMDEAADGCEILIITGKDSRNVVMLSEEAYVALIENIHVMGSWENYDWLMKSKKQLEGKA